MRVLALLFSFRGRIGIRDYLLGLWINVAFWFAVFGALAVLTFVETGEWTRRFTFDKPMIIILIAMALISGVMLLALAVKRVHDIGKSGWWSLVGFVPYVNTLFDIGLLFVAGDKDTNAYGPPQKPLLFPGA